MSSQINDFEIWKANLALLDLLLAHWLQLGRWLTSWESSLLSNTPMNFANILLWLLGEVLRFHDGPEDVFAPKLTFFLFIDGSKVLADELGIDSDQLDQFEPKTKDLALNEINVIGEQVRKQPAIAFEQLNAHLQYTDRCLLTLDISIESELHGLVKITFVPRHVA